MDNTTEIPLSEYWRLIRKNKWTLIGVFAVIFFSTVIFTKTQKVVYEATLELRIERATQKLNVAHEELAPQFNLASEMRFMSSPPILEKVVEKMEVLPVDPTQRIQAIRMRALDYQGKVKTSQIKDTNIIRLQVSDENPKKAALTATAIADAYIEANTEGRKKQLTALLEYSDTQLQEYKQRLEQEEARLNKFQQNEKVFEVTPLVKANLDRMTVEQAFEFEKEMLEIEAQKRKVEETIKSRRQNTGSLVNKISDFSENFVFVGLKRRLLELEFERFLLLIDYTMKHPSVIEKDKVMAGIKNRLVEMIKDQPGLSLDDQVEEDLALLIKKMFLDNRREVLYRIVNKHYGDSGSLSVNQREYVELKRNVDRLVESYNSLITHKEEAKLGLAQVIDNVIEVIAPAVPPQHPIRPNARLNYLVSSVMGLLLGVMGCFLKESLDTSVTTLTELQQQFHLPVLGMVPLLGKEELNVNDQFFSADPHEQHLRFSRARLMTVSQPKSWAAESFKIIRANLLQLMKTEGTKAIVFTSSEKQEGKTTVILNMAISMAQMGKRTILIGANLRRPMIHKILGLHREPGLTDVLIGKMPWTQALKNTTDLLVGGLDVDKLLQMPGIENLKVLTSGQPVDNISEVLNSKAMLELIKDLKNHFDVILIDCPPVLPVPDVATLSDRVDGVVMIYRVGETAKDSLKMAKHQLQNVKANILGVILNGIKTDAQVGASGYHERYYQEPEKEKNLEFV